MHQMHEANNSAFILLWAEVKAWGFMPIPLKFHQRLRWLAWREQLLN